MLRLLHSITDLSSPTNHRWHVFWELQVNNPRRSSSNSRTWKKGNSFLVRNPFHLLCATFRKEEQAQDGCLLSRTQTFICCCSILNLPILLIERSRPASLNLSCAVNELERGLHPTLTPSLSAFITHLGTTCTVWKASIYQLLHPSTRHYSISWISHSPPFLATNSHQRWSYRLGSKARG